MNLMIHTKTDTQTIPFDRPQNLLSLLQEHQVALSAVCGGNRSCGKCKVRIHGEEPPPTEEEIHFLSQQEIADGIRLACAVQLESNMEISIDAQMISRTATHAGDDAPGLPRQSAEVHAVVDLGSTTVTAALVDRQGKLLASETRHNAQAVYAADVVGRVRAANAGKRTLLCEAIQAQIGDMLHSLLGGTEPLDITVCGNTVMLHLFYGESCAGLDAFPYTPVFLEAQRRPASELGLGFGVPVQSPPCIAVFAGADITAGILTEQGDAEGYTLLMDLGTNAEIALFDGTRRYVTSAAAGPVFEGGHIRQGMAATEGAISAFSIVGGEQRIQTVGAASARGICGSGLVDIVSALLQEGLIDPSGRLLTEGPYPLGEEVALFAEDVRALQLAKAAIAAAAALLLEQAGLSQADVSLVAISGGLGSAVNPESAAAIGLIPKALREKTVSAGNTSLTGGIAYAICQKTREQARQIAESTAYLDLATHPDFLDRYVEEMAF